MSASRSDATADTAGNGSAQRALRRSAPWLGIYAVALGLIAFWPQHVDRGMGSLLRAITQAVPVLTYERIEIGANVLLFVPLGILLAGVVRRRLLVVPIGFAVSLVIEAAQGLLLPGRTASLSDVVANTAGTCVGLLLVITVVTLRRRRR